MGQPREQYPEIALTDAEQRREALMKRLGESFQHAMVAQGNACALKGGTAMRLSMGLPRPSSDLDFEGQHRIPVRKTVQQAIAAAAPGQQNRVGWDWLRRGTVGITVRDRESGETLKTTVDYRKAGSRPSIPTRIDTSKCKRVHGINVYNDSELAERKLHTVIGENPRQKPRDIYDAGWLVHERPELITSESAAKLKEWMAKLTPDRKAEMKEQMRDERVIGRCDVDLAWRLLENGISRLNVEREPTSRDATRSSDEATEPEERPKRVLGTSTRLERDSQKHLRR